MSVEELQRDIEAQLRLMAETARELSCAGPRGVGVPGTRLEVAGFGALLMNLYSGFENILKRIAQHEGLAIPAGPRWHAELFSAFARPLPSTATPLLTTDESRLLRRYRDFRHLMVQGCGVALRWELMKELVASADSAFETMVSAIDLYLRHAGSSGLPASIIEPRSV